jgi:hypothetical protein
MIIFNISPDYETAMAILARYTICASFSQERIRYQDQEGNIVYTSKDSRASNIFPALEWLANLCAHIPNRGEQRVRYCDPLKKQMLAHAAPR